MNILIKYSIRFYQPVPCLKEVHFQTVLVLKVQSKLTTVQGDLVSNVNNTPFDSYEICNNAIIYEILENLAIRLVALKKQL